MKILSTPTRRKLLLISFCLSLLFIAFINTKSWAQTKTWKGGNTQWNLDANWTPPGVPGNSNDVTIPQSTYNPIISTEEGHCKSITIDPLASLTLDDGLSLKVYGNWTNNGIFVPGTGTVIFKGSSGTQTISGNTDFYNLTLENTSTNTDFGSSITTIAGKLSKTAGYMVPGNGTIIFTGAAGAITGDGAKSFYNLQINNGAVVSNSSGGNLTINNNFYNNGIFKQDESLTTFFRGTNAIHNLTGGGSTTFGNVNIEVLNTIIAGSHNFTVSGSKFVVDGTFNGDQSNVTLKGSTSISGSGNINFNDLTLSGTDKKTIAPGTAVTVNGDLTTSDKLTINSDATNSGSLIVNGTCTGNVTYNRYMADTRWYITSAPVITSNGTNGFGILNSSKIHQDATDGNKYDFAPYVEPSNAGWNYLATVPNELTKGQGYLISLKSAGTIQFTGTLNNGTVTKSVTTSTDNGWNAVGNPYTSAIKIAGTDGFILANTKKTDPANDILSDSYAAIYVWNEDAVYTGQQFYKAIGNSGYKPPTGTTYGNLTGQTNIQVGQGFLINSKVNGTVTFNTAMQVSDHATQLKSSETSWPGITLLAESKGQTRSTVVAFNENMSAGLDVSYDCGLLASDDFQLYTHLADGSKAVDFAVQCLPNQQYNSLKIPLGIDLPEGGELVFKASGILLPDRLTAFLEDHVTGIKTALKSETDSYTVSLDQNTSGIGRFYLSVAGDKALTAAKTKAETKYTASLVNNRIILSGAIEPETKAMLFDLNGRKLGEYTLEQLNRNEISVSGLNLTLYLLKIEDRISSQTIKLIHVKNNPGGAEITH